MNKIEAALRLYEEAREDIFAQCLSNPIQNAWGKQVNVLKLNQAHEAARAALRDAKASAAPQGEYPPFNEADFKADSPLWDAIGVWAEGEPGEQSLEFADLVDAHIQSMMRAYYDLGRAQADSDSAREVILGLTRHIERNTCEHHETYRGGAIWEICSDCGEKWADDQGGKPEFKWPESYERAREFLRDNQEPEGFPKIELREWKAVPCLDIDDQHTKMVEESAHSFRAAAPALEATEATDLLTDDFRGDNAALVRSIDALLNLDALGCLVPNGIGGHARDLLSAAAARLAAAPQAPAAPECLTCSDHGAVGNILTAEPCPDCTPAPADPSEHQLLAEWNRVAAINPAGDRRLACMRAVLKRWGFTELTAMDAETIKKAARYDWLKENAAEFHGYVIDATGRLLDENGADHAIDAAIEAQAKKGGE